MSLGGDREICHAKAVHLEGTAGRGCQKVAERGGEGEEAGAAEAVEQR